MADEKHIIDCDAAPLIPQGGWDVHEHQPGGQLEWNPDMVELYVSEEQQSILIEGHELRKKLKSMPILNANVLDYLLDHPELIPNKWKCKYIYFWGTIYRGEKRDYLLFVRYLRWMGFGNDEWCWYFDWLGAWQDDNNVVAVVSTPGK